MNQTDKMDTFDFDIGFNDIDDNDNPQTPKFAFMSDHTIYDSDILDFFSEAQFDAEPINISEFFSDIDVDTDMLSFDYLFENNQKEIGKLQ